MASSATGFEEQASLLLEKTDIIASTPHALEALVDPYPGNDEVNAHEPQNVITLLQRQLQAEAGQSWPLACIPRPWQSPAAPQSLGDAPKHPLPEIIVPPQVLSGKYPRLPEVYFSLYGDQDIETVPPQNDIACSIIRDSVVDTINALDFNRVAVAKFLVEIDCFFAEDTFVKRATPFDKLRDLEGSKTTWKPEDVVVDAVFSQLAQLPVPEHKIVYYHSVLTEACKLAPAAIAPSLGRAIRFLYRNIDDMDLELGYRFMDWFSHHLSNFGFTWKWTEW
jgi:nuclear cap-binding protein subunit 1